MANLKHRKDTGGRGGVNWEGSSWSGERPCPLKPMPPDHTQVRSRVPTVAVSEGPLAQTTPHFSFWLRNKTLFHSWSFLNSPLSFSSCFWWKLYWLLQSMWILPWMNSQSVSLQHHLYADSRCHLFNIKQFHFFFPIGTYCLFKYRPYTLFRGWHTSSKAPISHGSRWNPIKLWYI